MVTNHYYNMSAISSLTTPSTFETNCQTTNPQEHRYLAKIDNISIIVLNYTDFVKDDFWKPQLSSLGIDFASNYMKKLFLLNVGTPNFSLYVYESHCNIINITLLYGQGNSPSITALVKYLDKEIKTTLSSNYEILNEINIKIFLYDNCINVSDFEFVKTAQNTNLLGSPIPHSMFIWKKSLQYDQNLELIKHNYELMINTMSNLLTRVLRNNSQNIIQPSPSTIQPQTSSYTPPTTTQVQQQSQTPQPSANTQSYTNSFPFTANTTTQQPQTNNSFSFPSTLNNNSTNQSQSTTPAFGSTSTTPAFGSTSTTPAFGSTNNSVFGSNTPVFGSTNNSVFGSTNNSVFGSNTPAFGSTNNSVFGNTSSVFGTYSTFQPQKK